MGFSGLHVPKILTQAKERAADSGAKARVLKKKTLAQHSKSLCANYNLSVSHKWPVQRLLVKLRCCANNPDPRLCLVSLDLFSNGGRRGGKPDGRTHRRAPEPSMFS